ncbi:MAG: hypothetical protein SPG73_04540, partial [Sodaliphilus sp.]|nr:hypothetical protein [Sodaliphilus sp.]
QKKSNASPTSFSKPTGLKNKRFFSVGYDGANLESMDKYWGGLKQKQKKQPFSDASASHLSLVLRYV